MSIENGIKPQLKPAFTAVAQYFEPRVSELIDFAGEAEEKRLMDVIQLRSAISSKPSVERT